MGLVVGFRSLFDIPDIVYFQGIDRFFSSSSVTPKMNAAVY